MSQFCEPEKWAINPLAIVFMIAGMKTTVPSTWSLSLLSLDSCVTLDVIASTSVRSATVLVA
jgi:hypothetical protein